MDLFAPRHLLIILVVVLLVFGTKKLRTIGSDLGGAVRGFKKAMSDGEAEEHAHSESAEQAVQPNVPPAIGTPAHAETEPTRSTTTHST